MTSHDEIRAALDAHEPGAWDDLYCRDWLRQLLADIADRDRTIADLRAALIRIVVMCGGATATDVPTEFLCHVPDEVEAALDKLRRELAAERAEIEEYRNGPSL
jgi:hypothetical protein